MMTIIQKWRKNAVIWACSSCIGWCYIILHSRNGNIQFSEQSGSCSWREHQEMETYIKLIRVTYVRNQENPRSVNQIRNTAIQNCSVLCKITTNEPGTQSSYFGQQMNLVHVYPELQEVQVKKSSLRKKIIARFRQN